MHVYADSWHGHWHGDSDSGTPGAGGQLEDAAERRQHCADPAQQSDMWSGGGALVTSDTTHHTALLTTRLIHHSDHRSVSPIQLCVTLFFRSDLNHWLPHASNH